MDKFLINYITLLEIVCSVIKRKQLPPTIQLEEGDFLEFVKLTVYMVFRDSL
jgi:hypothetical protein